MERGNTPNLPEQAYCPFAGIIRSRFLPRRMSEAMGIISAWYLRHPYFFKLIIVLTCLHRKSYSAYSIKT